MASIRQRNGSFEVRAQHGGKVYSKTFRSRAEAERWGAGIELGFIDAPTKRASNAGWMTFKEAAERYGREVTPSKKGREQELNRLKQLTRQGWARKPFNEVSTSDIKQLRDGMLERGLSGSTVRLMLALVSVVFKYARQEWDLMVPNPVAEVRIPKASAPRYRRLSAEEEERLEDALDRCKNPTMAALVCFALQTGMRRSELVQLKWTDVDFEKRLVILRTSKNGHPRWIPLTAKALEQLRLQQVAGQARPFDISVGAVSLAWVHVVRRAGIENLRFHDLRHEALSRWAHRLGGDVFKLSLVSGHKTLQMARRYVHPVESELLASLNND
jgi:integrase